MDHLRVRKTSDEGVTAEERPRRDDYSAVMLNVRGIVYAPGPSVVHTHFTRKHTWRCVLAVAAPLAIMLCATGTAGSEVYAAPQVPATALVEYATLVAAFVDAVNVAGYVNVTEYSVFDLAVRTGPVT